MPGAGRVPHRRALRRRPPAARSGRDEAFFASVNESASTTGEGAAGWGDLSAHWDAASFEAALDAPAGAEERSRLVAALVDSFFRGYREVARGSVEAFVSLDDGLAVIARHARDLG